MATLYYNDAYFRALFPAFNSTVLYPLLTISAQWDMASGYITDNTFTACVAGMTPKQQVGALNLMTAHLLYLNNLAASGQPSGVVTGATIDKVSVTLQPPPEPNQWQWWLNQSPYGAQLLALLQVAAAGGRYYTAGVPVVPAFRR